MIRDKRLRTFLVLLVSTMALLVGCATPKPQPFNLTADQTTLTQQYVEIKKANKLKGIKKVAISQYFVEFVTKSYGGATASNAQQKSSSTVGVWANLKGIETEQFQAITDKMYEQMVEEFKKAGIEVIPVEQLKQSKSFQKLVEKEKKAPYEISSWNRTSQMFAAKGLPLYFDPNDKRLGLGNMFASQFSNFNPEKWEEKIAEEMDTAVLKANFTVTYANMETKGGQFRNKAEVNTDLKVTLIPEDTNYTVVSKNGTSRFILKEPVFADGKFIIEVKDALTAGDKTANALSSIAGAFSGTTSKTLKFDAKADSAAYKDLVEKHIGAIDNLFFNQMKANF
ncbi:MAG: hypothetical protein A2511_02265 [Deltaproteobacteria bacterium RIFOXYD12_FULL_50_9]|nr:MAG: hypothetical protein A2511_02265 [Deltaproteobacteria bacterium RIFOXYD12_FULL_50_9]